MGIATHTAFICQLRYWPSSSPFAMQPEFCNCMPWPPRARQHLLGSSLSNARHYVTGGLPGSKTEIACIGCRCVLAFIRLLIKRTAGLGPHPEPVRAMVNRYTQPTRNYTQPLGIAAMSTLSLLLPGRPLAPPAWLPHPGHGRSQYEPAASFCNKVARDGARKEWRGAHGGGSAKHGGIPAAMGRELAQLQCMRQLASGSSRRMAQTG